MSTALQSITSTPPPTIPEGWAAKAEFIDLCLDAGRRLTLWLAIAVAAGRDDFADPGEWIQACGDRWGWKKSRIHHLRAIGDMLLRHRSRVSHATLLSLDSEKLLSISRLPEQLLEPFLAKADPAGMRRDEVRASVNRWLAAAGEPTGPEPPKRPVAPAAPNQPDFLDALFGAAEQEYDDIARALAAAEIAPPRAIRVLNRSLMVAHAMLPHIDRTDPETLRIVATALREEAEKADRLASGLATVEEQLT